MKAMKPGLTSCLTWLILSMAVFGQPAQPQRNLKLKFDPAPLDLILKDYSEKTGRTLLLGPKLPSVSIVLRSQEPLTLDEYLQAIETVLSMHGVALVREGDTFLKVVPSKDAREESMTIRENQERNKLVDSGELTSQLITLTHIDIAEADKAIKPLLHKAYGQVNRFERINSVLVTDTAANINRILQVLKHLDQPIEAREEPNVVQIRFAKASEIKKKLEEIISDSQKEQKTKTTISTPKTTGSPGMVRRTVPGVIRAPRPSAVTPEATVSDDIEELAERGIISGKVHIVADDRVNLLIIITRPENMTFFEKIVKVLDVETAPDVVSKVIRLEYADAETVASTLNTLIGSSKKEKPTPAPGARGTAGEDRAAVLRDYVEQMRDQGQTEEAKSKVGHLTAENIKILPDKRTNSLLVMASKADLAAIEDVVKSMDMMLSQVLIEAVILEVQLGDSVQTGIDWVQRAMVAYDGKSPAARMPRFSFAGSGGGGGDYTPVNATTLSSGLSGGQGLTYYFTYFGLNLDMVLHMAAGDSRTKIVSSPVIVTHDNTEAKIDSSEERYFYKGKKWVGVSTSDGRYEDDVEVRKVGLHLTVTPHINQNKFVVMEIKQQIEELAEEQKIGDTSWPTVLSRDISASISVHNRETIVLGGLVKQHQSKISRGIPILCNIPLIGPLFGFKKTEESRSEIIIFITPYVLNSPEEIAEESARRKNNMHAEGIWKRGWSESRLAEGAPGKSSALPAKPGVLPAKSGVSPESAEKAPPREGDPHSEKIDPKLLEFIDQQERKWDQALQKAEQDMTKELQGLPPSK